MTWLFYRVINQYLAPMNRVRAELGLDPYLSFPDIYHQVDLRLMQTSQAFDAPITPAPPNLHYVGPVLDAPSWVGNSGGEDLALPFQRDASLPLVVVSLSTTFQNQQPLLQRIITALSDQPLQCLVTLGPAMTGEHFTHGANVVLVPSFPHAQVFPHASAVITHAGHSTVMKALSFGVPLVCLPMGRDQNDNAALVQHHGAGFKLSPLASAATILHTLQRVLDTPSCRDNARRLQHAILQDAQSERAEQLLEQLMRTITLR